jgi:predicted transcriptional regulator
MAVTTIKVETTLRDRLNLIAREQGVSVSRALETMVAERERAERFRHDEYLAEATAWDSTLMDGLDESRNG